MYTFFDVINGNDVSHKRAGRAGGGEKNPDWEIRPHVICSRLIQGAEEGRHYDWHSV
jgi:hypothetical protein